MPPKKAPSKSPAPAAKKASPKPAARSKTPPPKAVVAKKTPAKPAASSTSSLTSPRAKPAAPSAKKASPKRASPKRSASSSKKATNKAESSDDEDEDEEDLPPATQNDVVQAKSPIPSAKKAAAPPAAKKAVSVSPLPNRKKGKASNDDDDDAASDIIDLSPQPPQPKSGTTTVTTAKVMPQLNDAVHAVFNYVEKRGVAQQQQNDQQDDVLALFGPKKPSAVTAAADKNALVSVEFTFLKAPEPSRIPVSIVLPHQVHDIHPTICLITPAPQEKYRAQMASADAALLNGDDEADVVLPPKNITKIIDVVKLEGRYADKVAARALANSYSAFFVHNEVDKFPKVLTGEFMSRHFPVWMTGKKSLSMNERLQQTMACVMMPRRGKDNVSVEVGHTKQSEEQLRENIIEFCGVVVKQLKGGWKDVLSIRLGFQDGSRRIALPIYAHDFRESHGLGTSEVRLPSAVKMTKRIRQRDEEAVALMGGGDNVSAMVKADAAVAVDNNKSSSSDASDAAAAAGGPKKPTNSAARRSASPSKASPKASPKLSPATSAKKKSDDHEDDDDDEIPQIDISAASPSAAGKKKPAAKKAPSASPAPKGKRGGSRK